MKKFVAVASLFVMAIFASVSVSQAQVSCVKVLTNSAVIIGIAEENGGQVLHMNVSSVDKGSSSSYTTALSEGDSYTIIAVGDDERVQDLDLAVYDENDNKIAEDVDDKNVAVVRVSPRWTGEFRCQVTGYKMSHEDAFYSIIIVRE